jgi:catalase
MNVTSNQGNLLNYEPNSFNGPFEDKSTAWKKFNVTGEAARYPYSHPNDDFEQPRNFYRKVLTETDRQHLVSNICESLGGARREIQERQLKIFHKVDPDLAQRVAKTLGLPVEQAKL